MATHRAIASTETNPESPITAALMKALDGNLTATAEGATGAPRVRPMAMDTFFGQHTFAGSTPATFVDLGATARFLLYGFASIASGSGDIEIALSNDNGASFASYMPIHTMVFAVAPTIYLPGNVLDLLSGNLWGLNGIPFTPLSGANAIRIRGESASVSGTIGLIGLSRT